MTDVPTHYVGDTEPQPDDEYPIREFLRDVNLLIGFINSGVDRLAIPAEQMLDWRTNVNDVLPHGWRMPDIIIQGEVRMPTRVVTLDNLEQPLTELIDTRDLYMDRCWAHFKRYDLDAFQLVLVGINQRREIVQAIADACHAEAVERELCHEYDELFRRVVRDMHFHPKGRQRDVYQRVTVTLVFDLEPMQADDDEQINADLRANLSLAQVIDWLKAGVGCAITSTDVETWH